LSSDGPGAGDRRFQAETALVNEGEGRALLKLFFPN
jgi:hypothetical protein